MVAYCYTGCHRYGYLTTNVGDSLTVKVNSDVLSQQDKKEDAKVLLASS